MQGLDQRAQGLEILVALQGAAADQVLVNDGDGAADVADLVGNRSHQNPRAGQELLQVGLLALAQLFGGIHDQGGQARAHGRLVSGKEDVGEEDRAVFPFAAALHFGAEGLGRLAQERDAAQGRNVAADGSAVELSGRHTEETVGGGIGAQDQAVGPHGEDGGGAAIDEEFQLLLGLAPRGCLSFDAAEVFHLPAAAPGNLVGEQAGSGQRGEDQDVLRQGDTQGEGKGIEDDRRAGAKKRRQDHLPAGQGRAHQQHGKEVQEAEGNVEVDTPVDDGDDGDEDSRLRQRGTRVALQETKNHPRVSPLILGETWMPSKFHS